VVTGFLNKHSILFEEKVFKTYLHCMKKAYKLEPDTKFRSWLLNDGEAAVSPYSPWFRLVIQLTIGHYDLLTSIWEKKKDARAKVQALLEESRDRALEGRSALTESTVISNCTVRHRRGVVIREFPEGIARLRGAYYGGPVRPGGLVRGSAIPYEQDPVLYRRDEDTRRGAENLEEVLRNSNLPRAKPGSLPPAVGGGDRSAMGIAHRADGRDYIYDIIVRKPYPAEFLCETLPGEERALLGFDTDRGAALFLNF